MKTAIITLSEKGSVLAEKLLQSMAEAELFVHKAVSVKGSAEKFDKVVELTARIFDQYQGLIYIMPCGVVTRAISPCIKSKLTDPAVVVVDVGGRFAISLLSGHQGRANELALQIANIIDAEPVITTTTEAQKTIIVGIGCRKGANSADIIEAINNAAGKAKVTIEQIRLLASADIKKNEPGLLQASKQLGIPIRFITSDQIRNTRRNFECSQFVQQKVNLPAVAEPAALLAGIKTQIILPRTVYNHVTIAIARENCLSSGSGREDR